MSQQPTSRPATTEAPSIAVLFAGDPPSEGPTSDDLAAATDRLVVDRSADFVDARDRIDRGAVDCVVATHRPDGFDGVAFLETIRVEHPELPVVLLPESVDADVARRAVDADATALVPATAPDALESIITAVENNADASAVESVRMPISDLTVKAEHRLKERALDEAPIGITISDATAPDQPLIYVNDSFEETTGYSPEEVIGANHRFLQGPDTDPDRVAELAEGLARERNTRVVLRNYTRAGKMFWNQVEISPIFDDDGEVTHYVGFQMDVTERKAARQQLQSEREALDRVLDRVNGLIHDVTEGIVRAGSREEIERFVTDRIGGEDEYAGAWLGRYDATANRVSVTEAAGEHDGSDGSFDLDGDGPCIDALREAVEEQELRSTADATGFGADAPDGTCVLVPLTYRATTYGVLAVFDDGSPADDRERVVLASLGRSVGASINDVLTKRTITSDTVLEISVELTDDLFLVDLARKLDARFEHEATIPDDDSVLTIVSTDGSEAETVVETAATSDRVLDAETLAETDDEVIVQFRLDDSPLVDVLSEFGTRITAMSADGRALELDFRTGTERAANRVLDALRETYDHVELRAYHEADPERTAYTFREELRNELTERQLVALQKAYVGGYFEWPREAEGQQLAESMDIVASTYHQHLQAAKRKLVEAFFDD